MSPVQRWLLGVRILVNLVVVSLLIQVVLWVAFAPVVLIYFALTDRGARNPEVPERGAIMAAAAGYAGLLGPLALTWVARWKGLPTWAALSARPDPQAPEREKYPSA